MDEIKRPKLDSSLPYGGAESHDPAEGHTKTRIQDPYGSAVVLPNYRPPSPDGYGDNGNEVYSATEDGQEGDTVPAPEPVSISGDETYNGAGMVERVPVAVVDGQEVYSPYPNQDPGKHSDLFDRASRTYTRAFSKTGRRTRG